MTIIKTHLHSDKQTVEGIRDFKKDKYPSAEKINKELRGQPHGQGNNPTVHSKNTQRYGHSPRTGAVTGSTGSSPSTPQGSQIAGSITARPANPYAPAKSETLGYFDKPTQPNTGKHTHSLHPIPSIAGKARPAVDQRKGK
jgi:hypothetical protein